MGHPVLLKNVSKLFSNPHNPRETCLAVDRINLELKEGELLTLAGPRGCGKSTVLKMIAGLEHPTEGEIYVDGLRVEGTPPSDRNVGFVVAENVLLKHLTVADNILSGLRIRKTTKRNSRRRFEQLVTLMGLEKVLDRSPDQLSGGQHRRVVLASVLASQPRVLLLDDPFAGLDPAARQQMRADTMLWQRELNIPTILATQDRIEAVELGGRIAILNDGRFQQIDTYRNLLENPANDFVSAFIGGEDTFANGPANGPMKALNPAGGAGLTVWTGDISVSPIDGTQRDEDHQVEDAEASNTFLGRPIRLEVRRHN